MKKTTFRSAARRRGNRYRAERITRRRFLIGSAALATVPALASLSRADKPATGNKLGSADGGSATIPASGLHFIAFGDWGTGTAHQKSVAEAMARYADAHKATSPVQFAMSLGDNFYENGVSSVNDPQWQTKFERMYDPHRLPMPFISVLGNHDWVQDPTVQIAYAGAHPGTRWQMDGFWFKRSYPSANGASLADFFYIDTDLWNYDVNVLQDRQSEWLLNELKNSRATWRIVVGHHPLYSNGEHAHDKDVLALRERLSPVFKQYGVDLYLCGHDHDLQRNLIPDHATTFLISGAAGKLRAKEFNDWGPFYASVPGFAALTVTETELTSHLIDATGKTIDTHKQGPIDRRALAASAIAAAPTVDITKLPDLSIILGEANKADGLSVPSDGDGVLDAVTAGGSAARRSQGNYVYVTVDNAAYRGPLDIWVTVEAFTDGGNPPAVHYDKAADTSDRLTRYTRQQGVWTPLENGWQRGVFALPQARLAKRQNNGADFRLSGKGVAVRKITVSPRQPVVS